MDPREALDITIKVCALKAADIARDSGVSVQMLSRYRKKHQDMNSLNALQVIKVLPPEAFNFFWNMLLLEDEPPGFVEKMNSAKSRLEALNLIPGFFLKGESGKSLIEEASDGQPYLIPTKKYGQLLQKLCSPPSSKDINFRKDSSNVDSVDSEESSVESSRNTQINDLVIECLTKHIKTVLREELTENFNNLKPILRELLTDILSQDNLALIDSERLKDSPAKNRKKAIKDESKVKD